MMDDFQIDDIIDMKKPKKKINTSRKGKSVERELCKLFNARFMKGFSRTIGSGNRWGQVADMPAHAIETFTGDICTPPNFTFCIESKGGYDDVDLVSAFLSGNSQLDEFIKQAKAEAERCGRKPLICWKKNRKPWLAILQTEDLSHLNWYYRFIYRDWSFVPLDELLDLPDDYWFSV